jgi:hypothetical protein
LNRRTQIGAVRSGHFQSPLMPGRHDQASTTIGRSCEQPGLR